MRMLLAVSALVFATLAAFAQSEEIESHIQYVSGTGTASGFCYGNDPFCLNRLQDSSRRDAERNASWQCQIQQGNPDTFAPSCSDFCNPNYLPPGGGSTYVSCRSDCQIRCELPDHNTEVVE